MFPDFAALAAEPTADVGIQADQRPSSRPRERSAGPPSTGAAPPPSGADPPPIGGAPPPIAPPRFQLEVSLAHTGALLFGMRAAEAALWPTPFAQITPNLWWQNYREAFTRPPLFDSRARAFEWDHDRLALNVVGHGLLGSELYFRPRRCGASPLGALAFAAGASIAWEYAFEGNAVRPSALDLAYTPLAGIVLGEGRYWGVRLANGVANRPLRAVLSALLDPFGEFERGLGAAC